MNQNTKSDKLLVLDLDETLVHATSNKLDITQEDFSYDKYFVYKRPHLESFLTEAAKHFTLGIWSSAGDIYFEEIVRSIKPLDVEFEIVWGRKKCTVRRDRTFDTLYFEKRLDKLRKKGFPLEKILIVDDSQEKVASNYGNAIYIKGYKGDPSDSELPVLLDYLKMLKDSINVRTIEKRYWRAG